MEGYTAGLVTHVAIKYGSSNIIWLRSGKNDFLKKFNHGLSAVGRS